MLLQDKSAALTTRISSAINDVTPLHSLNDVLLSTHSDDLRDELVGL